MCPCFLDCRGLPVQASCFQQQCRLAVAHQAASFRHAVLGRGASRCLGAAARLAVPDFLRILIDPIRSVRKAAANALLKIDPPALINALKTTNAFGL
jgi:HEAT repeat protein